MPRLYIVAALSFLVAGCGLEAPRESCIEPLTIDETYRVYDAVLAQEYGFTADGPRLVIGERTLSNDGFATPTLPGYHDPRHQ